MNRKIIFRVKSIGQTQLLIKQNGKIIQTYDIKK